MNFISIHDTHRLPYNNATITAKRTQEGNTTPLEFFNAVDKESLGYEVYTNARGYICDRDGNLYTKGVFVREDAYVTATLGDGASTSWIVRPDSDVTINDGELLGRIVDNQAEREQEEREGKEFVLFNGHWHLKLHSANTPDNRTLPLKDLDEVPAFNEWKEVEQVVQLKTNQKTVVVEEYTKVLVLQWDGTKPENHNVVDVSIDTQVIDGRHRYAQHCLVYNQTGMRLTLKNTSSPQRTIGIIAPDGTMNMGLFFLESSTTGEWIADDRYADWDDGLDANQAGGDFVYVEGTPTAGPNDNKMFEVEITDRTPNVLNIVARNIDFAGMSPRPGAIKIKLTGRNITKPRELFVWFTNNDIGSASTLPAVLYAGSYYNSIVELYPDTLTRIRIPTGNGDFTTSDNVMLLNNADRANEPSVRFDINGGTTLTIPKHCDHINITNSTSGGIIDLLFDLEDAHTVRFDVNNTSGSPIWFNLRNPTGATVQLMAVCPPNDTCTFTVRNSRGLIYPVSETEAYPTGMTYHDTAIFDCSYGIKGLATTVIMDCSQINRKFDTSIGDHNTYKSDVVANIESIVPDGGLSVKIRVKFGFFLTTADEGGLRLWLGSTFVDTDFSEANNILLTSAEQMTAEDEGRYYLNPGECTLTVSRVGHKFTNHGVSWK